MRYTHKNRVTPAGGEGALNSQDVAEFFQPTFQNVF
jgi:hypothetical protein